MTDPMTLAAVRRLKDPQRRAAQAAKLLASARDRWELEQRGLLELRDDAIRELLAAGVPAADVAKLVGVTRALISKRFGTKKKPDRVPA